MQNLKLTRKNILRILAAALILAVFAGITLFRPKPIENPSWTGPAMGTTYTVKLADARLSEKQLRKLQSAVEECLKDLNRQMSTYQPDSEISRFNAVESTDPFPVSASFAEVCRMALRVSELSGGAFDPTVQHLVKLWGFGGGQPHRVPSDSDIADTLKLTGYRHVRIEGQALRKDIPGVHLDLGAIAPGRGSDEIAALIRDAGWTNFFVELGGEVVASGHNPDGHPWRIGIDRPVYDALPGESFEAIVQLSGHALATSGDYRSYFCDDQGNYYTHILNPATGRPVHSQTASVTVIAPTCMLADALSTTLFVLGPEKGEALLRHFPGCSAFFILRQPDGRLEERLTPGFVEATGLSRNSP